MAVYELKKTVNFQVFTFNSSTGEYSGSALEPGPWSITYSKTVSGKSVNKTISGVAGVLDDCTVSPYVLVGNFAKQLYCSFALEGENTIIEYNAYHNFCDMAGACFQCDMNGPCPYPPVYEIFDMNGCTVSGPSVNTTGIFTLLIPGFDTLDPLGTQKDVTFKVRATCGDENGNPTPNEEYWIGNGFITVEQCIVACPTYSHQPFAAIYQTEPGLGLEPMYKNTLAELPSYLQPDLLCACSEDAGYEEFPFSNLPGEFTINGVNINPKTLKCVKPCVDCVAPYSCATLAYDSGNLHFEFDICNECANVTCSIDYDCGFNCQCIEGSCFPGNDPDYNYSQTSSVGVWCLYIPESFLDAGVGSFSYWPAAGKCLVVPDYDARGSGYPYPNKPVHNYCHSSALPSCLPIHHINEEYGNEKYRWHKNHEHLVPEAYRLGGEKQHKWFAHDIRYVIVGENGDQFNGLGTTSYFRASITGGALPFNNTMVPFTLLLKEKIPYGNEEWDFFIYPLHGMICELCDEENNCYGPDYYLPIYFGDQ